MQLTQKIKINVNTTQEEILNIISEKCRLIYNFALTERKKEWEENKKNVSYITQQNNLPKIKEQYPEYNIVYSKVLQHILRVLDDNYKSFYSLVKKDKTARPPKYLGKKHFTTLTYNQSGFKIVNNKISFSHKYNKEKLEFIIPDKFIFQNVKQISIYKKDKCFWLSITYEEKEREYVNNNKYQAFDLGIIKQTCINSDGKVKEFINKRPDRYWKPKLEKLQSRRDHCKKYSNKYNKLNKNLIKIKRKSANQLKDFQHKLSNKIINNTKSNTIIVGDLSVKKMKHKYSKTLNTSLMNSGSIARFVQYLTYKAKRVGKRVISINESMTSKTCSKCGKIHNMPLDVRNMNCGCGNNIDRDVNSSINIMKKYLSQNGLWTSYQQFVDNVSSGISV
jgi:putative transposase